MIFGFFDFFYHMLLQIVIPFHYYFLENRKDESSVETAPVSPGLSILFILPQQILDLDVETLIIDELIHQESQRKQLSDERRFSLYFLTNFFLLLFMHLELLFKLLL